MICGARTHKKTLFIFAPYALVGHMTPQFRHFLAIVVLFMSAKLAYAASTELGIFSHQRDIGNVARPGSVNFDPAKGEYLIAGGGGNMWYTNDDFPFCLGENVGRFHVDGGR